MGSSVRSRHLVAVLAVLVLALGGCASEPSPSPSPSAVSVVVSPDPSSDPSPSPSAAPSPSPSPSDSSLPSYSGWRSDSPWLSVVPTPTPFKGRPLATRVVIPKLGIDLAIVKSPPAGTYPYCNVAMYFGKPMGQPGENRATYIFAHARDGMFGPIYVLTMVDRTPNKMVGMIVEVYTSDSMLHTYKIVKVLPHQLTMNGPASVRTDQLWLQTSEGPHGTPGKTQVVANPVSTTPADYADAHPKVHIVRCGY